MQSLSAPTSEAEIERNELKVDEEKEESEKEESEKEDGEVKQPPFLFRNANGLLNMTRQHNVSRNPLLALSSSRRS